MSSPWYSHVSIDFPASATSILGAEAGSAWGPKNTSVGLYEELIQYKDYEIRDIYEYENINVLYIYIYIISRLAECYKSSIFIYLPKCAFYMVLSSWSRWKGLFKSVPIFEWGFFHMSILFYLSRGYNIIYMYIYIWGIPLVIIQFTWIFRYKPSILGYPHYIIYIYTLYIYIYHIHRPEPLHSHFKEFRCSAGARWL